MIIRWDIQDILDKNIWNVTVEQYDFLVKIAWCEVENDESFKDANKVRCFYTDYDTWEKHQLELPKEYIWIEWDEWLYEEETEEIEEEKEYLTTKQKNIMFVTVLITIIAFFLWFKYWVKPLNENDLKYINGLKIDKSIYSFERELTQAKFDLEDTLKLKEKQEKQIKDIENSLTELRDKK